MAMRAPLTRLTSAPTITRGALGGAKGDTPIVQATGARHGMSLISAVTARGHMRFMIIDKGSVKQHHHIREQQCAFRPGTLRPHVVDCCTYRRPLSQKAKRRQKR